MSAPWPPPPDLDSLRDLFREADVEGFIARHGAPADEYDPEAQSILDSLDGLKTADLTVANLTPLLNQIWKDNFSIRGDELELRQPTLRALAAQIARFFGPEAVPQTRSQPT